MKTIINALLIGTANRKDDNISVAQLAPLLRHKRDLYHGIGINLQHINAETFTDIQKACLKTRADIIFIRPTWREDSQEAEKILQGVRAQNPGQRLVFLDPFDQTSSRYFNLLPYTDSFLKYQRLKDISQYTKSFVGGSFLTDYLAQKLHYDLNGWHVGSQVGAGLENRIGTYWNFGILPKNSSYLKKSRWARQSKKDIDIFCRLSFGPPGQLEWYGQYRLAAVNALKPLASKYSLAVDFTPEAARQVSRQQYLAEIKRSRIVFSPFGWGEVTWRDYEAACHGCLLVKPCIDHIHTEPNIFYPGETYVPVRWDFQDLEETCDYYLQHPEEAQRIIDNAQRVYRQYFEEQTLLKTIQKEVGTLVMA